MKLFPLILVSMSIIPFRACNGVKGIVQTKTTPPFSICLNNNGTETNMIMHKESSEINNQEEIKTLPPLDEYTFSMLPSCDVLDSEETDYNFGAIVDSYGEIVNLSFFKYTFFIKNNGPIVTSYNMTANIAENNMSSDGRSLDDSLRVMLFENDADSDDHQYKVWAKRSKTQHLDGDGYVDYREAISTPIDRVDDDHPFYGYAEQFESDTRFFTIHSMPLYPGECIRYTFVFWLEGEDPDSTNVSAPDNASLKMNINIDCSEYVG